ELKRAGSSHHRHIWGHTPPAIFILVLIFVKSTVGPPAHTNHLRPNIYPGRHPPPGSSQAPRLPRCRTFPIPRRPFRQQRRGRRWLLRRSRHERAREEVV